METPFIYGKKAYNQYFIGNTEVFDQLYSHICNQKNVVLVSPRGWGKSSLIEKAVSKVCESSEKVKHCTLSLSSIRTAEQFYSLFVNEILKSVSSDWKDMMETARRCFSVLTPKIDIGKDPDFSLDFDWEIVASMPEEVLSLPEKAASEKGVKILLEIEDVHNIAQFEEAQMFMERMRNVWENQNSVQYLFSGCRRDLLEEMFLKHNSPLKGFAEYIQNKKPESNDFVSFIKDVFASERKYIDDIAASLIVELVDSHPNYVQYLAQISWLRTYVVCTEEIVRESFELMLRQLSLQFITVTDDLTSQQLCYLRAILAGEAIISHSSVLHKYRISSATSASRSKVALIKKGILDIDSGEVRFVDPVYAHWLKFCFFEKNND